MPIRISRENLADEGQAPIEVTEVAVGNSATLSFAPQWAEGRDITPAQTRIANTSGSSLDGVFFDGDNRVVGQPLSTTSRFQISSRADIAKLAKNLEIPADDIASVSYTKGASSISHMSVTYRENITAAELHYNNAAMTLALERRGVLPPGTTFEMGNADLIHQAKVEAITTPSGPQQDKIESVHFTAAQNSSGSAFDLRATRDGSYITVGRNQLDGRRFVTGDEYKAAQKIAEHTGGVVKGESGASALGISIEVPQPIEKVATQLADAKMIHPDVALSMNTPLPMPESSEPGLQAPHVAPKAAAPVMVQQQQQQQQRNAMGSPEYAQAMRQMQQAQLEAQRVAQAARPRAPELSHFAPANGASIAAPVSTTASAAYSSEALSERAGIPIHVIQANELPASREDLPAFKQAQVPASFHDIEISGVYDDPTIGAQLIPKIGTALPEKPENLRLYGPAIKEAAIIIAPDHAQTPNSHLSGSARVPESWLNVENTPTMRAQMAALTMEHEFTHAQQKTVGGRPDPFDRTIQEWDAERASLHHHKSDPAFERAVDLRQGSRALGNFLVNNTDYSMAGVLDQALPHVAGGSVHEVDRTQALAMVKENDAAFKEAYIRAHARASGKPIEATSEVVRGLEHASRNFQQAPPEHQDLMKSVKAAMNARGTYEVMVGQGRSVDPKATADLLHALHAEVQSGNITHPQTLKAAGLVLDAAPKLIPQLAPKLQSNLSAGSTQNSPSEAFSQQAIVHAADAIHEKWKKDFTTVHGDIPHWKPLNEQSQAWIKEHSTAVPADAQRVNMVTGKPELNIIVLTNKQLPPQYANENVASAKGAIEAISKNPTASMEELAATVHDQWMQRNGHWAPASQMVPYARLSESDKQEDRDVVQVGQKAIAHAEKVSSANRVASSLPTQGAPSVPRINEPTTALAGSGEQSTSATHASPSSPTSQAPDIQSSKVENGSAPAVVGASSGLGKLDSHAGNVVGKLGMAEAAVKIGSSVYEGDYTGAAKQTAATAMSATLQNKSLVSKGLHYGLEALKIAKVGAEEVPLLGALAAGAGAIVEVGRDVVGVVRGQNSFAKVGTTIAANGAEIAGGLVGFGGGQVARQATVEVTKHIVGSRDVPDDSAIVGVGKDIYGVLKDAHAQHRATRGSSESSLREAALQGPSAGTPRSGHGRLRMETASVPDVASAAKAPDVSPSAVQNSKPKDTPAIASNVKKPTFPSMHA